MRGILLRASATYCVGITERSGTIQTPYLPREPHIRDVNRDSVSIYIYVGRQKNVAPIMLALNIWRTASVKGPGNAAITHMLNTRVIRIPIKITVE